MPTFKMNFPKNMDIGLCASPSRKGGLTPLSRAVPSVGMGQGKRKISGSREASKNKPPLGFVIALAAAGGVVAGSAGTYFLIKPEAAPKQSASPAAGGTTQPQSINMPPPQQFTPASQPPGEAPPGKVWSVEHGHWHDIPIAVTAPVPEPSTVITPAATATPSPVVAPAEK